jgi:hypothetical protein
LGLLWGFLGALNWVFVLCKNLKINKITSAKFEVLVLNFTPAIIDYVRVGGFEKFEFLICLGIRISDFEFDNHKKLNIIILFLLRRNCYGIKTSSN